MVDFAPENVMDAFAREILIKSVRFIFFGALICLLDFEISFQNSGGKVSFDILHDLVGMVLIATGINLLRRKFKFQNFQVIMAVVLAIIIILIIFSLPEYIPGLFPKEIVSIFINLYSPVFLLGATLFCLALRSLCQNIGCVKSAKSWRLSMLMLLIIYTIPVIAFLFIGVSGYSGSNKLNIGLFPILIILIVGSAPCIHMMISLKRTLNELASRPFTRISNSTHDQHAGLDT